MEKGLPFLRQEAIITSFWAVWMGITVSRSLHYGVEVSKHFGAVPA